MEIDWELTAHDAPRLRLVWTELGGKPVIAPTRRGFGTRLIERSLAQDLGGTVAIDFEREGVICTVDAPLEAVAAPAVVVPLPRVGGMRGTPRWN